MKKILTTLASLAGVAFLSYGQGTVTLLDSAFLVQTNTGVGTGNAGTGTRSYYYTVLVSTYDGSAPTAITNNSASSLFSASVTGSTWTWAGIMGTNNAITKGAIGAPAAQVMAAGIWDGPTTSAYTTGTIRFYEVIGWSANEGSDWGTISNSIVTGNWAVTGAGAWFGASDIAYNYSGGGTGGAATVPLFTTSTLTGLTGSGLQALSLFPIVSAVPEPSTFALAALGGASLLLFRRRK